jgi:hypothetical protein
MKWCLIYFAAFRVGLRELKLPKILADCSTAALPFVIEVKVGIFKLRGVSSFNLDTVRLVRRPVRKNQN